MAFKKVSLRIVTRDVDIYVPVDGRGTEKAQIKITWEVLRNDDEVKATYDKPFFTRVIKGWDGYVSEEGEGESKKQIPVPFNESNLASFLADDFVIASLQPAYIACTVGAARGNF